MNLCIAMTAIFGIIGISFAFFAYYFVVDETGPTTGFAIWLLVYILYIYLR